MTFCVAIMCEYFVCLLEYNPNTGLDVLKVQPVSMAQARQRLGRAGRQCPGQCYRLYTEEQFYSLQSTTTPEIQRCNLSSVVLQLMALGVKDVRSFDFMDAPLAQAIQNAVDQLTLLGALDQENGEVMWQINAIILYIIHDRKTRNKNDLHIPIFKTCARQRTLKYRATKLWNDFDSNFKNITCCNIFKRLCGEECLQTQMVYPSRGTDQTKDAHSLS